MFLIILFTDNLARTVSAMLGYLFHANQLLSDIPIVRYPAACNLPLSTASRSNSGTDDVRVTD